MEQAPFMEAKGISFCFCFRYDIHLADSRKFGVNKGFGVGFGLGIFQITTLGTYGLALWYGISCCYVTFCQGKNS